MDFSSSVCLTQWQYTRKFSYPPGPVWLFPRRKVVEVLDEMQDYQPAQTARIEEACDKGGQAIQQEVKTNAHKVTAR